MLQRAKVDQGVDQCVEVGDGRAIAQLGALDAEVDGLSIDALGGGALFVDLLVGLTVAVKLVTDACANAGGERGVIETSMQEDLFPRNVHEFWRAG